MVSLQHPSRLGRSLGTSGMTCAFKGRRHPEVPPQAASKDAHSWRATYAGPRYRTARHVRSSAGGRPCSKARTEVTTASAAAPIGRSAPQRGGEDLDQPVLAIGDVVRVEGFGHAVGEQEQRLAGGEVQFALDIGKSSTTATAMPPGRRHQRDLAILRDAIRRVVAGIHIGHPAAGQIDDAVQHGDEQHLVVLGRQHVVDAPHAQRRRGLEQRGRFQAACARSP